MLQVILPLPPRELNPNRIGAGHAPAHIEETAKATALKNARLALRGGGVPRPPIWAHLAFFFPDMRLRDEDNLVASCKAQLDGIAAALGVNDHSFRLHGVEICVDPGHPRLVVTLRSAREAAAVEVATGFDVEDEMAERDPLLGLFALTFAADGFVSEQCHIEAKVSDGHYLCQFFSWIDGGATSKEVRSLAEIQGNWRMFADEDEWRDQGRNLSCARRDASTPTMPLEIRSLQSMDREASQYLDFKVRDWLALTDTWADGDTYQVRCPVCGDVFVRGPRVYEGDGYETGEHGEAGHVLAKYPPNRGLVTTLVFEGESCTHRFAVTFGVHKGELFVFTEILTPVPQIGG